VSRKSLVALKKFIFLFLITTYYSLLTTHALCGEFGLTTAQFLRRDIGTRVLGLAGVGTALSAQLESLGYNPAGLTSVEKNSLMTNYINGFSGSDNFGVIVFGTPALAPFKTALGVSYYDAGNINLNLSNGIRETRKAEQDLLTMGSLAFEPLPYLSLGATLKYCHLDLAQEFKANATAFDGGAIMKVPLNQKLGHLSIGTSILNIGQNITLYRQADPIPTKSSIGAVWQKELGIHPDADFEDEQGKYQLLLAGDYSQTKKEDASYAYGFELAKTKMLGFLNWAALRLGYRITGSAASFHFGFGWGWSSSELNYALVKLPKDAGLEHHISYGIKFGHTE